MPRLVGNADRTLRFCSIDGQEFTLEKGVEIKANRGRFGPYLQFGTKRFVSLKEHDPESIQLADAMLVIEAKLRADAEKLLLQCGDLQVLQGRWGPYVSDGNKNASLGKQFDWKQATEKSLQAVLKAKGKPVRKKSAIAKKK